MTQNENRRDQYSENRQKETERQRERETETKRHLKRYYCALCIFSFEVSRSSFSSFPRDDDDLNFPNGNEEPLMGPRERHRIIIIIALSRCTREEEKHSRGEKKRERERDKERETVIRTFFMCACIMCACASSRVFVSLNIALCAVCAHATRSALRSEEKTRVCYEKEDFVSISHFFVSIIKNRGKHEKKDVKKGKREKVFFFGGFFRSLFLSRSVSFCSHERLVVKSNN